MRKQKKLPRKRNHCKVVIVIINKRRGAHPGRLRKPKTGHRIEGCCVCSAVLVISVSCTIQYRAALYEQRQRQRQRQESEAQQILSPINFMAESEAEAQPNNPPPPPASHSPLSLSPGAVENMDGRRADLPIQEGAQALVSQAAAADEIERKARVDAVWQQMDKGISAKTLKSISTKHSSVSKKPPGKNPQSSTGWMTYLGLGSNKTASTGQGMLEKRPSIGQNGVVSEDAKEIAAAALSAVKDAAAAAAAAAATGKGKIEIKEVRDFAGEEIEVKKLVDAASKEGKAGPASAVDAVLEQIKKKPKLSVLDKTKKDWGEFKEENQGMEEELDAYKKSSNQYLDRVSFLQRADYREFERERDARLALQAKRKTADMREDD